MGVSKREDVIKALAACLPETEEDAAIGCAGCPCGCCKADTVSLPLTLVEDIRAVLKEQESQKARLLTADEMQHLQDRQTVCVEQLISRDTDEHGYVTGCGWGVLCNRDNSPGNGLLVSMLGTFFPNTITKIPYEAMHSREDGSGRYTIQFRFWTDRPTVEESKAVAWDV